MQKMVAFIRGNVCRLGEGEWLTNQPCKIAKGVRIIDEFMFL